MQGEERESRANTKTQKEKQKTHKIGGKEYENSY